MAPSSTPGPRGCSSICLPFDQDSCHQVADDPRAFRRALDQLFQESPELFPRAFAHGYRLKDSYVSHKFNLSLRRICYKGTGETFTIRPS